MLLAVGVKVKTEVKQCRFSILDEETALSTPETSLTQIISFDYMETGQMQDYSSKNCGESHSIDCKPICEVHSFPDKIVSSGEYYTEMKTALSE